MLGRLVAAAPRHAPRPRLPAWPHAAGLAKKAAAPPKKAQQAPPDSGDTVRGLNILQGGSDPALRADGEYPDWLWTIHEPLPSLGALQAKVLEVGGDALSDDEKRRMLKLWNRQRIRERNAERKR